MSSPSVIRGIGSKSPENWKSPQELEYPPRKFNDDDVLIKVHSCGVCGSDVHASAGNWGPYPGEHLVVGHEIVGRVEKVGPKVTEFKVGDIVGVGAAAGACGECENCKSDNEQYCNKLIQTYNTPNWKADGYVTQGGYSSHVIIEENFVFPIPEGFPEDLAGPLMCAGLTVFSPLWRSLNGDGKGKTVGIIGIGGLGHLAIQFAKALGAEVVAFSRSSSKKADALKLGADEFIATGEEPEWNSKYSRHFDLLLNCATSFTGINYGDFFPCIKVGGDFITVGAPAGNELLSLHSFQLIQTGASMSGSLVGSKKEALIMLDLAAKNKIYPVVEKLPISVESVQTVLTRAQKSDVKYRFVLTDIEEYFDKK
ncbi:NADP-dependent alcohol dehydrogenase 7 [[Candida] jaroonii]|uniref:NADP-dependent alcohol dehydrogenase 7 n=1 Tax=[Candida] jaroonii TaxID=467808 RepID=A0ACA9Y4I4_9ASCO|nr:NADP-dependent alcohol dehydrogenase 7 [[Candida] jaroonii]